MRERTADLAALQDLLDRSYRRAGSHLRSIITPERRMSAERVAKVLTGMSVLALATVTADSRPLVGGVDGIFFRGEFWFGSAGDSVRWRHLRRRSAVSATHMRVDTLSVTVHGRAIEMGTGSTVDEEFRSVCIEIYGDDFDDWAAGAPYARIAADRMFAMEFPAAPG